MSTLKGHKNEVTSVSFSHDGTMIATASSDNTVRVIDVKMGSSVSTLVGHTREVTSVSFTRDGARIAPALED